MKIKHCFQRFAAVMACLMLGMFCLPDAAHAAAYRQLTDAQMAQTSTFTLEYSQAGTTFRMYKVADMDRNVQFTLTQEFAEYSVFDLKNGFIQIDEQTAKEAWLTAASTLAGYVAQDRESLTPAAEIVTDSTGKATASGLPVGLYLVVGESGVIEETGEAPELYTPVPFLAALPAWDAQSEEWSFASAVEVKPSRELDVSQRRVLKVWDDAGNEVRRPSQVVVDLLRDGEIYDTVTLNAENNWRAAWTDLDADAQWQLTERDPGSDYRVAVELQGITFVVTNTYTDNGGDPDDPTPTPSPQPTPEPPVDMDDPDVPLGPGRPDNGGEDLDDLDDPGVPYDEGPDLPDDEIDIEDPDIPLADLPQTGQLWWPVPLLALAGAGMFLVGWTRRGRRSDEHAK